jgi:hypothetical protein
MTFGTWRWWGCQPHAPASFTHQEMFLVLIFTRGWVDPRAMVRSEGNRSLKNPVTPPGINPGTVGLVAQCLNHYTTTCPTIIVQQHKASIFFSENAGSIILWNVDNNGTNCTVSHSKNLITNMIRVFWLEMLCLLFNDLLMAPPLPIFSVILCG